MVKTDKIPLRVVGSLNQASYFGLAVARRLRILRLTCSEVVILKVFQHCTKLCIIIVLYATSEVTNLPHPIILVALLKANFLLDHFKNIHGSAGFCNKRHIYLTSYFVIMPTFVK